MFDIEEVIGHSHEMQILKDEGVYKPFYPDLLVERNPKLADEFVSTIKEQGNLVRLLESNDRSWVYAYKMYKGLIRRLVDESIATQKEDKVHMDRNYVLLYMSLLAKYMANLNSESVMTPSTDNDDYLALAYPSVANNRLQGLSLDISGFLPTPTENVRLNDILKFKERRKDELLQFRQSIYNHQDKIKQAKDVGEIRDLNSRFAEQIQIEVSNLGKAFKGDDIHFFFGSLKNLLAIETPALIAAYAMQFPDPVKLNISIAGAVISGAISLGEYFLDSRNKENERLAQNSFSYLFHAQQEGII